MALRGGYQIIDLQGNNITEGASFTIPGIYEAIEGSAKVILLSGIVVDGIEERDVWGFPTKNSSGNHQFQGGMKLYYLLINPDDLVTVGKIPTGM